MGTSLGSWDARGGTRWSERDASGAAVEPGAVVVARRRGVDPLEGRAVLGADLGEDPADAGEGAGHCGSPCAESVGWVTRRPSHPPGPADSAPPRRRGGG